MQSHSRIVLWYMHPAQQRFGNSHKGISLICNISFWNFKDYILKHFFNTILHLWNIVHTHTNKNKNLIVFYTSYSFQPNHSKNKYPKWRWNNVTNPGLLASHATRTLIDTTNKHCNKQKHYVGKSPNLWGINGGANNRGGELVRLSTNKMLAEWIWIVAFLVKNSLVYITEQSLQAMWFEVLCD